MLGLSWEPFNAARLNRKNDHSNAGRYTNRSETVHLMCHGGLLRFSLPGRRRCSKSRSSGLWKFIDIVIIDTMLSQNEGEPKITVVSWWCFMQIQYGNPLMFIITPLGRAFDAEGTTEGRRWSTGRRTEEGTGAATGGGTGGTRRSAEDAWRGTGTTGTNGTNGSTGTKPPSWPSWQQVIQQEEASHWVFGMKLPDASEAAEPISFPAFQWFATCRAEKQKPSACCSACLNRLMKTEWEQPHKPQPHLYAIKQNLQDFCCSNRKLKGFWHAWVTTFVTLRNVSRPYVVRKKTVMAQIPSACTRACEACEQLATILTSTSIQTIHPFFLAFTKRIQHALRAFCPMIIHL